jgi:hypothetical protein
LKLAYVADLYMFVLMVYWNMIGGRRDYLYHSVSVACTTGLLNKQTKNEMKCVSFVHYTFCCTLIPCYSCTVYHLISLSFQWCSKCLNSCMYGLDITVFWDASLCSSVDKHRHLRGTWCLSGTLLPVFQTAQYHIPEAHNICYSL